MAKYLDILPKICTNKEEGVARAVIIEDMIKKGTMFAEIEVKDDGTSDFALRDSVSDILDTIYRRNHIVVWSESLNSDAAMFGFNVQNQKVLMLFPMNTPGFKEGFLSKVVSVKGGEEMAKKCPKTNDYVLYLDCKECENRAECEAK